MIERIMKRLTNEQVLMEAFKAHIAPAVLGEQRLPIRWPGDIGLNEGEPEGKASCR